MEERFENFTAYITKIYRSIKKIKELEIKELDLKAQQVMSIFYLGKYKTLTSTKLSEICFEDRAQTSRNIALLKERGLVRVDEISGKKNYLTDISLTDEGIIAFYYVKKKVEEVLDISNKGLSKYELETFYKSLKIISNNLEYYIEGELDE